MERFKKGDYIEHSEYGVGIVIDADNSRNQLVKADFYGKPLTFMITNDLKCQIRHITDEEVGTAINESLRGVNENSKNYNPGIVGSKYNSNLAIKCNYCDGGSDAEHIGFSGICSDKVREYNIDVDKKSWCNNKFCPCLQYHEGLITRDKLETIMATPSDFVCYESKMLSSWMAKAGLSENGRPLHYSSSSSLHKGSVCILTTRSLHMSEIDRYIFGVFIVDELFYGDDKEEGYVKCNTQYHIELNPQEAKRIKFWNYYRNQNAPETIEWGTGLHRYVSNQGIINMLKDLIAIRESDRQKEVIEFLKEFCRQNNLKMPDVEIHNEERPIVSFSCGNTYELVKETCVHAHPVKAGFPSKKSPYLMVRAQGGTSESLYEVVDVVDIKPLDNDVVQKLSDKYNRVIEYINKRLMNYGFKYTEYDYRFYVLREVYRFDEPFVMEPNPQGHRYLSFEDLAIVYPDDLVRGEMITQNPDDENDVNINETAEREEIEQENQRIEEVIDEHLLEGEDRLAVVKARVNQGVFRDALIRKYKRCCLCGADETALLIASHIKPWVDSSGEERTDVNNGLLLCPNHDKLFDRGYISFEDDGKILLSDSIDENNRKCLNINSEMRINMSLETQEYMKYHRENRFII